MAQICIKGMELLCFTLAIDRLCVCVWNVWLVRLHVVVMTMIVTLEWVNSFVSQNRWNSWVTWPLFARGQYFLKCVKLSCVCLHAGLKTYLISGKKMGSQCGCSQNSLGRDNTETPRPSPHTHTSELTHSATADHNKVGLAQTHTCKLARTRVCSLIHTPTHISMSYV